MKNMFKDTFVLIFPILAITFVYLAGYLNTLSLTQDVRWETFSLIISGCLLFGIFFWLLLGKSFTQRTLYSLIIGGIFGFLLLIPNIFLRLHIQFPYLSPSNYYVILTMTVIIYLTTFIKKSSIT